MTNLQDQPDFDLDEDLFGFAGVARESEAAEPDENLDEIFASFRDPFLEEELLDVPAAPSSRPSPEAQLGASEVRSPAPPPVSSAPINPSAPVRVQPVPVPEQAQVPSVEITPAPRQARLSKSIVAIALAVTVLNSALAVVVLGRRGGETNVQAVSTEPESETSGGTHAAPPREGESRLPDPENLGELHAHPALDEARTQISRGEYSAARQRVYGLLAIIDRLDDPRRSSLEADCRFLIAQSLHLEALARMGGAR